MMRGNLEGKMRKKGNAVPGEGARVGMSQRLEQDNSTRPPSQPLLASSPPPLVHHHTPPPAATCAARLPNATFPTSLRGTSAFALLSRPTAPALRIHSAILNVPFCPLCAVPFPHLSVTLCSRKAIDDQAQEQAHSSGDILGEEEARRGREGRKSAARAHQPWKHLLHELDSPGRAWHSSHEPFLSLMIYECS